MELRIKKLHETAIIPTRAKPGDSGLDLYACVPEGGHTLYPGKRLRFNTGIAIELPKRFGLNAPFFGGHLAIGWEGQVRGRSGLAAKGIIACGGIGTVDNGYRGEIGVVLLNASEEPFFVHHGDRIAQLVVAPVIYPSVVEVSELTETDRGQGGFGSTGR